MNDTLIRLYQPESGELFVPYKPDESTKLIENPPRFTWMPAKLDEEVYVLEISNSEKFLNEDTIRFEPIPYNFFTPDQVLLPGTYYWRYALLDFETMQIRISDWSRVRRFDVPDELAETPLPSREARYNQANMERPRLWLSPKELETFRIKVEEDESYCQWSAFLENAVKPFMELPFTKEPAPYPNNKRVADLWRQMYLDCQEALHAVRHLSVAGVVLKDEAILAKAKEWLMHLCSWDTEGTTARDYNDESAFRIAGALAWGYDWLYHYLSDEEREEVKQKLYRRTEQVAYHVIERSKIHHVPYDSHAVRSLSSVLVPCCIALLEDEPKAKDWLDYTLEYYNALYTPWGGADGGWAEGPHYWMTGMAYVIDAINLVKKFNGYDLYKRPFFQKTGDFPLFTYPPTTYRSSFGDQSNLGDRPGLKVGFNIRQFAGVTGNPYYQWYFEQTKKLDKDPHDIFYNKGWWDFYFDEMMYLHDFPEIEAKSPADLPVVKWFKDVDWVAIHNRMDDPNEHIMFLTKSSHYGSISHSHGDQNAFILHAFGDPLAMHSGYYVAFNSTMHMRWRRQTISKNAILINGKGQFAEKDKFIAKNAQGKIEAVEETDEYVYIRANATKAYKHYSPEIENYQRETYFVNRSYFVIIDTVDLEQPGTIDWLLHSLYEPKVKHQGFVIEGEKASLEGKFIYSSSGEMQLDRHQDFPEVDLSEIGDLPIPWRIQAQTKAVKRHRIVTLLQPMKKTQPKYVSHFIDDQDHGLQCYFTEDGNTFRVEVPKAY
ncbi:DUF4962 domain-containing protein [Bacillus sp. FJAT-50079]|uniref:DUF4962 domain-containing protein n=1 Tax=Bacillus sp. FJAT-50079 TaxID=2833577 RepID=UPI001BC8ED50|nr:DUF4962 domain-containing protein [Bacillus sp. FJAT-50079]MBS4208862.1 DUF4962 domain-containing protein [Bacillus sp. FJAT-50079]